MVARVTQYRIRPGKIEEFITATESLTAAIDKIHGFRALLVVRGEDDDSRDAMAISVWDTPEDMHASDNDKFYYHVVAQLMHCCESFSPGHEHPVLVSKFANK